MGAQGRAGMGFPGGTEQGGQAPAGPVGPEQRWVGNLGSLGSQPPTHTPTQCGHQGLRPFTPSLNLGGVSLRPQASSGVPRPPPRSTTAAASELTPNPVEPEPQPQTAPGPNPKAQDGSQDILKAEGPPTPNTLPPAPPVTSRAQPGHPAVTGVSGPRTSLPQPPASRRPGPGPCTQVPFPIRLINEEHLGFGPKMGSPRPEAHLWPGPWG